MTKIGPYESYHSSKAFLSVSQVFPDRVCVELKKNIADGIPLEYLLPLYDNQFPLDIAVDTHLLFANLLKEDSTAPMFSEKRRAWKAYQKKARALYSAHRSEAEGDLGRPFTRFPINFVHVEEWQDEVRRVTHLIADRFRSSNKYLQYNGIYNEIINYLVVFQRATEDYAWLWPEWDRSRPLLSEVYQLSLTAYTPEEREALLTSKKLKGGL
jgi:hypothetical protein